MSVNGTASELDVAVVGAGQAGLAVTTDAGDLTLLPAVHDPSGLLASRQ